MRCCITVLLLSGCFWCSITQGAEETEASWRVVILHSSDTALPASVLLEQTARKTLLAGTTRRIEFYTESLDGLRLPDSGYESTFVEFLRNKYKHRKPDITGFSLIGAIALVALAMGCTGMQTQSKENLLIAAGFKVIVPHTAAQQPRKTALRCVRSYRERMAEFAQVRTLEVWYARLDLETILPRVKDQEAQKRLQRRVQKAETSDVLETDFPKLVSVENGEPTIWDNPEETPPLRWHKNP
jgi:hypothetical protein